jgi:hypothetical protein
MPDNSATMDVVPETDSTVELPEMTESQLVFDHAPQMPPKVCRSAMLRFF